MNRSLSRPLAALLALAVATPLAAARLDPGNLRYLGFFTPPAETSGSTYRYWLAGLSVVPDCLGRPDPSPGDGYPGCLLAIGHPEQGLVGVFDIVPPGSEATQVVPFWDLVQGYPRKHYRDFAATPLQSLQDVLYDRRPDGSCRIWWTFMNTYGQGQKQTTPFLGYSSCDPAKPDPHGMWGISREKPPSEVQPRHPNKYGGSLSFAPDSVARTYLGGRRMLFSTGHDSTRGGSAGPSMAVRPDTVPTETLARDFVPLLYYHSPSGFPRWYLPKEFPGFNLCSRTSGGEMLASTKGEAMAIVYPVPLPDPDAYPADDPKSIYVPGNPGWKPVYPPPDLPVVYYGVNECKEGPSEIQQPSYQDYASDGSRMPKDCRIRAECPGGTGPHCNNVHLFLYLYDLGDLAAVLQGKRDPRKVLPYARRDISFDFDRDGRRDRCGQQAHGTAYDAAHGLLFVAQGDATPAVHVFALPAPAPEPPPKGDRAPALMGRAKPGTGDPHRGRTEEPRC